MRTIRPRAPAPSLLAGLFAANEVVPGSDVVISSDVVIIGRAATASARVAPPGMPIPSADLQVP